MQDQVKEEPGFNSGAKFPLRANKAHSGVDRLTCVEMQGKINDCPAVLQHDRIRLIEFFRIQSFKDWRADAIPLDFKALR